MDKNDFRIRGTLERFEEAKKEKEKYFVEFAEKKFIIYPSVFSPKYFKSPEFSIENVPINLGDEVLEVGCGAGIFSIMAVFRGAAKVVACDINENAVLNTRENIELYEMKEKIKAIKSDVYDSIPENSKFDLIFWNVPFLFSEEEVDVFQRSTFDPFYKSIKRFVLESKNYLKPNGRLILEFSKVLGNYDVLKEFFDESEMDVKEIKRDVVDYGEILGDVDFELFELRIKN